MANGANTVRVLTVYLICLFVGQAAAVGIGLALDPFSKTAALATFIPVYYAMYWLAWRIALYIADKSPSPDSAGDGGARAKLASLLIAPAVLAIELAD